MSPAQDGQRQKDGRTVEELVNIARRINVEYEICKFYERGESEEEFSYSLEDREQYNIKEPEDCEAFVKKYGSGKKDVKVYIVGITKCLGRGDCAGAIAAAKMCKGAGKIPFIGQWRNKKGRLCVDIAFARNHGVDIEWARKERRIYEQDAVVEVTRDGYAMIMD